MVNCTGAYHFGDRDFHCWNSAGHGEINLEKAIYLSCNIYFYHLMQKLSLADWKQLAEKFGLAVHAVGVGERATDLQLFEPKFSARSLLGLET